MREIAVGVVCEGVAATDADWLAQLGEQLVQLLMDHGELSDGDQELSLMLCDDATIRPLNAQWRGKDAATDVLSFPLEEPGLLGDVVISVETADRRVDEPRWARRDELAFLLIHGLLHLVGHDHEEEHERAAMEAAEQRLWEATGRHGALRG